MAKHNILILILIFCWNLQSQNVDYDKVSIIGSVLCECLNSNKSKTDQIRINECTSVLSDGLSVIEDKSLREEYAQKSDTYLQRICPEYTKLIYRNVPSSDISLVKKYDFEKARETSINDLRVLVGSYRYKDFIGDVFEVTITNSYWVETISSSGNFVKFMIDFQNQSLIYKESNDPFFKDYYKKGEHINVSFDKVNDTQLNVILDLGDNLYIKKVFESVM